MLDKTIGPSKYIFTEGSTNIQIGNTKLRVHSTCS